MNISLISGSSGSGHLHLWKELRAAQQAGLSAASTTGTSVASTVAAPSANPSQADDTSTATGATSASAKIIAGLNTFLLDLQQNSSSSTGTIAGTSTATTLTGTGTSGTTATPTPAGTDPLQAAADQLVLQLSSVVGSYTTQAGQTSIKPSLALAA